MSSDAWSPWQSSTRSISVEHAVQMHSHAHSGSRQLNRDALARWQSTWQMDKCHLNAVQLQVAVAPQHAAESFFRPVASLARLLVKPIIEPELLR